MNHAGVDSSELTYVRAAKGMAGWTKLCRRGEDGRSADRRRAVRADDNPQGRPRRARHVLVPGEDARRKQGALGLLQGRRHHPGS
jgi:hypothetical protein